MSTINQWGEFHPLTPLVVVREDSTRCDVELGVALPDGATVVVVAVGLGVVVGEPGAAAWADEAADPAAVTGPVTGAEDCAGAAAAGMKRPVRFQKAEKPLKGPPTIWLDHCRV